MQEDPPQGSDSPKLPDWFAGDGPEPGFFPEGPYMNLTQLLALGSLSAIWLGMAWLLANLFPDFVNLPLSLLLLSPLFIPLGFWAYRKYDNRPAGGPID